MESHPETSTISNSRPPDGNTANFAGAIAAAGFVFTSGHASVGENGAIVTASFGEEMDRSIRNLERALGAHGCALADVVKVTSYVRDTSDLAEYNARYRDYFDDPLPARTTLTGCLPSTIRFEIDAIALVPVGDGSSSPPPRPVR